MEMKRVCVFCGSSPGLRPEYAALAARCGSVLAGRGLTLVYGGGNVGLMGCLADAVLASGGEVIGVIPRQLIERGLAHSAVTTLLAVESMHERKRKMAELADAFIALPGGIGTMEEFFEIFTWLQLGIHHKPVGLLDVASFYRSLQRFLEQMCAERFLKPEHLASLFVEEQPEILLDRLAGFVPSPVEKWMERTVPVRP
jgi:uncharacterized protein (TIGR00730 family)